MGEVGHRMRSTKALSTKRGDRSYLFSIIGIKEEGNHINL